MRVGAPAGLALGALAAFALMPHAGAEEITEPLVIPAGESCVMVGDTVEVDSSSTAVTMESGASLNAQATSFSGKYGIKAEDNVQIVLSECSEINTSNKGIVTGSHAQVTLTDASIATSKKYGIELGSNSQLTLQRCSFTGVNMAVVTDGDDGERNTVILDQVTVTPTNNAAYLRHTDVTMTNCTFTGGRGLQLSEDSTGQIEQLTVHYTTTGVLDGYAAVEITINSEASIRNSSITADKERGMNVSGSRASLDNTSVTAKKYGAYVSGDGSLTADGNSTITSTDSIALYVYGSVDTPAMATLQGNTKVSGKKYGVGIIKSGMVNITENATVEAPGATAIYMQPGSKTEGTPAVDELECEAIIVNMTGGTIQNCNAGIQGHGNYHGTTVNISGGSIMADSHGIFQAQYGKLHISGGEVTGGETAVEMRSGEITLTGGTLMSQATEFSAGKADSGTTTCGAALAISQHGTDCPISVSISGGTLSGVYALYEEDFQNETATDQITMSVSGGNFYGKIYSENCASFITGGNFNDASALAYLGANAAVNVKLAADYTETMPLAISDHSTVNLDMNGKSITGDITVEENSTLNFTALDILPALTASQSRMLRSGRNVAANIINGALVVDGTSTVNIDTAITVKTVTLESGSTTNVDGSLVTADTPAVTVTESTGSSIAEGAIINIKNLDISEGENLKLFSGEITQEDLLKADLQTNNVMQEVVASEEDGAVTIVAKNAADVLPDAELGNLVTEATKNNTGNAFLDDVLTSGTQAATKALNSVANMGEMAAVNRGAYTMMGVMTDALGEHLSLTHGTEREYGKGVWANFISHNENVRGMQLAGLTADYDARYNGLVFGSDLRSGKKTTLGIGLTYAQGDIDSVGGHLLTRNDAEYYGLGLYGRSDNRFCSVLYDLSYMRADNDITQYNSGHVVTATAHSNNLSAGVKAEKALKTCAGTFLPYVGLRYMSVNTKDYSNNVGMRYDVATQNIWTLPVGVAYSYEKAVKSWKLRAIADIGYVWAMGDTDTEQSVRLGNGVDSFSYDTMDEGSFVGRIRLEGEKGRTTIGAGYEYRKGDSVSADRWSIYINRVF